MIPLQKKKAVSMILGFGDEPAPVQKEEGGDEFEAIAGDVIAALEAKDKAGMAAALKAFFYACDAEPHEEGEHT